MVSNVVMSIIIVNWNTRTILADCLQSILDDIGNPADRGIDVYVVDNASSDGSVPYLRAHFAWVKLIVNEQNVGFARGNNQAIRQCDGRYVLLLNSDTIVKAGALTSLIDFMEQNPTVGAAGSMLLNPDGSLQHSCYHIPSIFRELWRLLHLDKFYRYALYDMSSWSTDQARPVEVVQGASMIVRREVLDTVGALDEDYFMYTEEVDWCDRILRAGWSIYWVPQSRVTHLGGQSTRQVAQAMFIRLYESKILFFRKHRGPLPTLLYKCVIGFASAIRVVASPVALLEDRDRRQLHFKIAGHYWHLLRTLPSL